MIEFEDEPDLDADGVPWAPGPEVTAELYARWRDARRGSQPVEELTNPVWLSLIASRSTAYEANNCFGGRPSLEAAPAWCCSRLGQSITRLNNGHLFRIGGEHEDHYDPDFFIYNDVIVKEPGGSV